jgi:hypothetical protein
MAKASGLQYNCRQEPNLRQMESVMRIGRPHQDKKRRLKPPPDYSSRRMQWRLLAAVAALMLVITLATEVRNPQRWKWLTELNRLAVPQANDNIDPRLIDPVRREPSEEVVVDDRSRPKLTLGADDDVVSSNDRAWASGWIDVFGKVSHDDRQTMYELLKAAREGESLSKSQTATAGDMIQRLDGAWADYRAIAKSSIQDLTEEEKSAWLPVLENLELRWSVETKPLLMILALGDSLSEGQKTHLVGLQDLLDRLELKAIQDNTPWRTSEREIWFRLLGKLQKRTAEELRRESNGPISYAQLFKQSATYRGKLVTVRGTAADVYWVEAPENAYGIKRYWVYWLRPDGANSPILVYSLHKPEGFPFIDIADAGQKKMPTLEDVEFTGFYFKRYAYQGQGGIFTAPMLLAREPRWLASPLNSRMDVPSPVTFLAVASGLAVLATALAVWVYYQYRPGRTREGELPARITIKS